MMTPRRYYSASYYSKVAPTLYGGRHRSVAPPPDPEVRRRTNRPPSLVGYAWQVMAVSGYSTVPVLRLVRAPTLVLAGDDDPIIPTSNPRLLARLIPEATLRIVPGAGHLLLLDSPEVAGPIISDFLDGGGA